VLISSDEMPPVSGTGSGSSDDGTDLEQAKERARDACTSALNAAAEDYMMANKWFECDDCMQYKASCVVAKIDIEPDEASMPGKPEGGGKGGRFRWWFVPILPPDPGFEWTVHCSYYDGQDPRTGAGVFRVWVTCDYEKPDTVAIAGLKNQLSAASMAFDGLGGGR
jgi:hypothetical protein